jgi:hypothetical protein
MVWKLSPTKMEGSWEHHHTIGSWAVIKSKKYQRYPEVMLIYVVSLCEPNGQIGYGWVRQDMDVIPIVV